jgi:adenine-specific DNA-methyltransferase
MSQQFCGDPIFNSPYECPTQHWFIDSDYNRESFFVRQAYFLGQYEPYKSLKTSLNAEIVPEACNSLNSDISAPFAKSLTGGVLR